MPEPKRETPSRDGHQSDQFRGPVSHRLQGYRLIRDPEAEAAARSKEEDESWQIHPE